jgi:beta-ureidopropionase
VQSHPQRHEEVRGDIKLTVAAAQFSRRLGDKNSNIERALDLVQQAASDGAELIALPELFSTGYFPGAPELTNEFFQWAEPVPGPTTVAIEEVTARLGVYVVAPMYEFEPRRRLYFNTAVLVGPEGVIGIYRKRHIPAIPGMVEKFYFSPGDLEYPSYPTPRVRVGMSICYDRHFPETFRHLTLRGAEVVASVNNTPTARSKRMWEQEIQVAASSNGIFIIQCNACVEPEKPFFGRSAIVSPLGEILSQIGEEEGIVAAEIDLNMIAEARLHYGSIRDVRLSDFALTEADLGAP